ncbi:MAG: type II toxin-antitoxin system VapC family toxin, partial [Pirellulales bacterium]|nr:type II toxin-antitoxin system VapC family toxin [Pirellulales bacterium]
MSDAVVIDPSIAPAWCFKDEQTEATVRLQVQLEQATAIVPPHCFLEVANALAMAERRGRITSSDSEKFISLVEKLGIEIDLEHPSQVFSRILPLARSHRLTV